MQDDDRNRKRFFALLVCGLAVLAVICVDAVQNELRRSVPTARELFLMPVFVGVVKRLAN
jgi:hypothetical protein